MTMAFGRHFTVEYLNSLLVKRHETKIDKAALKIISCTKNQACTSKNIAPKDEMTFHLLPYPQFVYLFTF